MREGRTPPPAKLELTEEEKRAPYVTFRGAPRGEAGQWSRSVTEAEVTAGRLLFGNELSEEELELQALEGRLPQLPTLRCTFAADVLERDGMGVLFQATANEGDEATSSTSTPPDAGFGRALSVVQGLQ